MAVARVAAFAAGETPRDSVFDSLVKGMLGKYWCSRSDGMATLGVSGSSSTGYGKLLCLVGIDELNTRVISGFVDWRNGWLTRGDVFDRSAALAASNALQSRSVRGNLGESPGVYGGGDDGRELEMEPDRGKFAGLFCEGSAPSPGDCDGERSARDIITDADPADTIEAAEGVPRDETPLDRRGRCRKSVEPGVPGDEGIAYSSRSLTAFDAKGDGRRGFSACVLGRVVVELVSSLPRRSTLSFPIQAALSALGGA